MRRGGWLVALGLVLLVSGVGLLLRWAQRPPTGPEPIAWDREACAECHMHVGEPRFAAQLQREDGQVLNFDDPGCLLRYQAERRPAVRAAFFHHLREERWLRADQVGFVPAEGTPMNYDLGAVEREAPGALGYEAAQRQVLARKGARP